MVAAIAPAGRSRMSNRSSSAPNSEKGLASIPMTQGGLSRLAIARLKSAGVPVGPLLRRVGLTAEVIADPEERLSVQSQIRLLDEAAIALKDDCLGFTLARDFRSAQNRAALLRHGVVADLRRWIQAGCSVQQDCQRVPRGRISRGKQAHYQPELLWRSSALRQTSNGILHVWCITNLPPADGAEHRAATLLDCASSIGRHLRNGAICRNESGVRRRYRRACFET